MELFTAEAHAQMGPLLEQFGFHLVSTGPNLVIYGSAALKVRVFQGLKSGTIGIEFVQNGYIVNLDDLLEASRIKNPGMTSRDSSLTRNRLRWLASFLHEHFEGLMSGDSSAFNVVQQIARVRDAAYNKKLLDDPDIRLANEAFREGRYREVIALLAPLETNLTASESSKLAYARKHERAAR
jgi:hypothetical protein